MLHLQIVYAMVYVKFLGSGRMMFILCLYGAHNVITLRCR